MDQRTHGHNITHAFPRANAHLVTRMQEGTAGKDNLYGAIVTMTDEGPSFVLTGRTQGDWNERGEGEGDFVAAAFSEDGAELWRFQVRVRRRNDKKKHDMHLIANTVG